METMNEKEKEAWVSFKDVVRKFLGNTKDPNYATDASSIRSSRLQDELEGPFFKLSHRLFS